MEKKYICKKTKIVGLVLMMMQLVLLAGCSTSKPEELSTEAPTQLATASQAQISAEPTPIADFNASEYMVGFLMENPYDTLYTEAAAHGFLQQAEKLGYPAKLYSINDDEKPSDVMQRAIDDGCVGMLVWADNEDLLQAVQQAKEAGLKVVVPYHEIPDNIEVDANPAVDIADYGLETARIMCEEILRRGKTEGIIVVAGADMEPEMVEVFDKTVREQYPQFQVVYYEEQDIKGIEKFVLEHEELVGVLALDVGSAAQWRNACKTVQEQLKPTPAPATPSDESTVITPTATPKPTPTPQVATASADSYKRSAVIIALDYNKENLELVDEELIYALIARPYYDSTAQSMAVMDQFFRVLPAQTDIIINVPIVRKNGIQKYIILRNEINKWFVGAPASKTAEPTPTAKSTSTPKATEVATASSAATVSSASKSGQG